MTSMTDEWELLAARDAAADRGDFEITFALDNQLEDLGAAGDDRETCHPCRTWFGHAHHPHTGARITRRPPGGTLLEWQKEFNATINQIRYVIERAIANFKTWRCMFTDYRRPLHTYPIAFHAVRALHFFTLRFA